MRSERWWWLAAFCAVSLAIHLGIGAYSRSFALPPPPPPPTEIEVALEPIKPEPEPPKKEAPKKPEPKPKRQPSPRPQPKPERQVRRPPRLAEAVTPRVSNPAVVEKSSSTRQTRRAIPEPPVDERPPSFGLPSGRRTASLPRVQRTARALPGGGGSPAPSPIPGGTGGASGPEAPPEDVLYNGGGAGGTNLPRVAPRMGGGGGRSILSVENPLARSAIPEERPGAGPGLGGGQGAGGGGGVGYSRGPGIGTRPNGPALGTLRAKPGAGIGAGKGSGIGTRSPGGGKGTGADLPGSGGTGAGYGRGSGVGIGNGRGVGVGNGSGGRTRLTLNRGIPFGRLSGLLRGGDGDGGGGGGGGGGGSPGRGAVFGAKPGGGGGAAAVHIVYVLDISGSMQQGNKIGKAQEALKKALGELKPRDSFNLIFFYAEADVMSDEMVAATPENIRIAQGYVENLRLRGGTNISAALTAALGLRKCTHIFLLSDGEPNRGIQDPDQLRLVVRTMNQQKAQIITLALGLGEQFPGIPLLKGLADDSGGQFSYVNLARQ